ncbi:hypothetical protein AAG570_005932 [Ranatra chinensis]|uniref:Zinc finger protein n=1 Tax=Ranatra chinensis TaxID=642074 RepID=A0ABD0XWK0_9HEMI
MADAMNLDPTDLGIEEFETLETIQAELERLDEERNHEGKVIIQPARNRVVMASELPQVKIEHEESTSDGMKEEEEEEVGSLVIEKMEEVYVEGDEEVGHPDDSMIMMMEDQTSNEPIQAGERRFAVFASSHQDYNSEDTSDNHGHSIFSETVVGEEIIEDEQVGCVVILWGKLSDQLISETVLRLEK